MPQFFEKGQLYDAISTSVWSSKKHNFGDKGNGASISTMLASSITYYNFNYCK